MSHPRRHPGVAVVTDSTAYLSADEIAESGVTVVPLQVVIDDVPRDEPDVPPQTVAAALRGHAPVTTSSPAPRSFSSVYAAAAATGATRIVSIHLSGQLSGTCGAAEIAAQRASVEVRVVDSGLLGMGLGFCVLAAAVAAAEGADINEVVQIARTRARDTSTYFYVATLEHLRRGGRIGAVQSFVGSALSVKPLLLLRDGRIEVVEKVRTAARALARLEDLSVDRCVEGAQRGVDVAVQHVDDAVGAELLAARLRSRVPDIGSLVVREVGAVVGAHVGPGLIAVAIAPR